MKQGFIYMVPASRLWWTVGNRATLTTQLNKQLQILPLCLECLLRMGWGVRGNGGVQELWGRRKVACTSTHSRIILYIQDSFLEKCHVWNSFQRWLENKKHHSLCVTFRNTILGEIFKSSKKMLFLHWFNTNNTQVGILLHIGVCSELRKSRPATINS